MNGGRTHDETLHRVDELTAWTRRLWRIVAGAVIGLLLWVALNTTVTSQKMLSTARDTHRVVQFIADVQNPSSPVAKRQSDQTAQLLLMLVNEDRLIHHLPPFKTLADLARHLQKGTP